MINIDWDNEVHKYRDEIIKSLSDLIVFESYKSEGEDISLEAKKALKHFLNKAENDKFEVHNFDGIIGEIIYGNDNDEIAILSHLDVVAVGDGWDTSPFDPTIREGKIYGRGAVDDKGPLIAAYYAMKILKDNGYIPNKKIKLIIGTDEEYSWNAINRYKKYNKLPEYGFVPDAYFPLVNGEKGNANIELIFNSKEKVESGNILESFKGGTANNIIPEKSIVRVKSENNQKIIEDFYIFLSSNNEISGNVEKLEDALELTIFGKASHSSKPFLGVNAITYMAEFLKNINFTNLRADDIVSFLSKYLHKDFYSYKLKFNHTDEKMGELTISPVIIDFNNRNNKLILNVRFPKGVRIEDIYDKIHEINSSIKVNIDLKSMPHYVDENNIFVRKLMEVYNNSMCENAKPITIGGVTYASLMKYGVAFGSLFPNDEDTMHKSNEYIKIDSLLKACSLYIQAIYSISS